MAEATVSEPAHTYTRGDAKNAITNVAQAIAILRAVQLAADAVEDGAMNYEYPHVTRWGPAIGAATRRVELVRDALMNRACAPGLDWVTSLALLEALDAALWHGNSVEDLLVMDTANVKDMCDAIIAELSTLKQELVGQPQSEK